MVEAIANGELDRAGLRAEKRAAKGGDSEEGKSGPFTFRFAPKGAGFRFNLTFRKHEVSRDEVIATLEGILSELRSGASLSDAAPSSEVTPETTPGG